MNIYPFLILFSQMLFCMPTFSCMASIFSCMIQFLKFSHMAQSSIKRLARAQLILVSQPNHGRAHTRPDQTMRHEQPSQELVRPVRHEAVAYIPNVHSAMRTSKTCTHPCIRPNTHTVLPKSP